MQSIASKKNTNRIQNQKSVIFAVTLTVSQSSLPNFPIHIESDLNLRKSIIHNLTRAHSGSPQGKVNQIVITAKESIPIQDLGKEIKRTNKTPMLSLWYSTGPLFQALDHMTIVQHMGQQMDNRDLQLQQSIGLMAGISSDEVRRKKSVYSGQNYLRYISQDKISNQISNLPKHKHLHAYTYRHLLTHVPEVYLLEIGWIERQLSYAYSFQGQHSKACLVTLYLISLK